jgi:hypothetical protein
MRLARLDRLFDRHPIYFVTTNMMIVDRFSLTPTSTKLLRPLLLADHPAEHGWAPMS